jgi:hypothetical protein
LQFEGGEDQKDTVRYPRAGLNEELDKVSEDLCLVFAEVIKGESKAGFHRSTLYDVSLYLCGFYHVLVEKLARELYPQFFLPHIEWLESARSKQD